MLALNSQKVYMEKQSWIHEKEIFLSAKKIQRLTQLKIVLEHYLYLEKDGLGKV